MRWIWGMLGLWITAYSVISAATMRLDKRDGLDISTPNHIRFSDWPQIQVSASLSLPAREVAIELLPQETASEMKVDGQYCEPVGQLPAEISVFDSPTSLDNCYDNLPALMQNQRLGSKTIDLIGEMIVGDRKYARFLVFPVTIDSSGKLFFCDSLTMVMNQQVIAPDRVCTPPGTFSATGVAARDDEYRSPASNADYVIITSSELAESFRPLAEYKMQTGYRTSVSLVEDITARYSGKDDAEKIREYLKDFHSMGGKYVLLGGDETIVPIRYAYSGDSDEPVDPSLLQVSDLYFAELTGNWNRDNDSVWGEKTDDAPDLTPELLVGRLPVNTPAEVANYVQKLIRYETDPGNGDPSYLDRAFFFSSDQMRDYSPITQHDYIARAFPISMAIDTVSGVEAVRGDDLDPSNPAPRDLGAVLSKGYGIFNVIAHGRDDGFAVKTSGYNAAVRAMLWTNAPSGESNSFQALQAADRPAFYYSLGCDNGAFDKSSPPFNWATRNMAQELIGERDGAVGLVAYSRWGWIGTSYILQRTFFDSLFAHPDRPAVQALYGCKAKYPYYRDLVLGQNYFGDPTTLVYASVPGKQIVQAFRVADTLCITVLTDGRASADARVLISDSNGVIAEQRTDQYGRAQLVLGNHFDLSVCISVIKSGCTIAQTRYYPSIVTDVDESDRSRPLVFSLAQNYPNPFNPATQIVFSLPKSGRTTLEVFDLLGRRVTTLVDGPLSSGVHQVAWLGTNARGESVAAGVYFYRLTAGTQSETRKMLLLK
ncbi:hypothetical protein C3F09_02890 [candidate division GN15 bacterium]|uniref:T9SS type A sorting domain-containing protein n=1 Tax=candidate division GN15 bacterium TaxID=2072418 RepID=A0A855X3H4_9BACT|nr:MAG: hypothetical protein C3F09_02890 [candidate division GN15 bacterium]